VRKTEKSSLLEKRKAQDEKIQKTRKKPAWCRTFRPSQKVGHNSELSTTPAKHAGKEKGQQHQKEGPPESKELASLADKQPVGRGCPGGFLPSCRKKFPPNSGKQGEGEVGSLI